MTTDLRATAGSAGLARPSLSGVVPLGPRIDTNRSVIVAMGVLGGLIAVAGSTLPWLSLYAGLQPITGLEGLNGRILAALGAVTVAAALGHAVLRGQGSRWLLGIAGFVLVSFAAWLGVQLLGTAASLAADPLLVSRLEPGLGVSLIGGSLVFATLFVPAERNRSTRRPSLSARHLVVAATLGLAGLVHIALTPEHLAGSILLGLGFLGTGVAQVLLAGIVAGARSVLSVQLAVIVSVFALAALISAVTVGLPIITHGGSLGPLGPVEPLDDLAAMTGVVQAITLVLAISVLRSRPAATAATP